MVSLARVALFEYRRNVYRRSFLLTLLALPAMVAGVVGVGILMESRGVRDLPIGYVDHAGLFLQPIAPPVAGYSKPVDFIAYDTEQHARADLDAGRLQAYYVLEADYFATKDVDLVYLRPPGKNVPRQFYDFVRINLLAGRPEDLSRRALLAGDYVVTTSLDGRRHVPRGGPTFATLMPLMVGLGFLALLLTSSGYLLQAFAEEKENRTMEVLLTSVSSGQLIAGKVVGTAGVGLTQLAAWILFSLLVLAIARSAGIGWLQDLSLDWRPILAAVALAIPCFVLASALMVAAGATVTSGQDSQSAGTLFAILHIAPLWLAWMIVLSPHGSLAVALSFLPFTSLVTFVLRGLFASIPAWQIAAAIGTQTVCALGAIWLAGRAFRLGMLRYGRRIRLHDLVQSRVR